jgi:crotonobetainyl-CoA:carnitine CoA-transferase CaiB-like acyl-CoA transferase
VPDALLDGVRVLDFSIWRPGPYATQLLTEIGADVVKVEPPAGDPMRAYAELFDALHRGQRSIAVDLKDRDAQAYALDLAARADVVVEGYRPGVAARLGIGYDAVRSVNAGVVYCSVSGLGQDGPLVAAPGHDLNYQAWAGALAPTGGPPEVGAVPVADLAGGMAAALAICAALVRRGRTGTGERIDVGMADVLASWTGSARPVTDSAASAGDEPRGVPGYGPFACADGYVVLGVVTEDHFWRSLCDTLALPGLADLGFAARSARLDELQATLAEAIAGRGRDELVAALLAADVPAAPVLDRDGMLALPHFRERGVVSSGPPPATGHPIRYGSGPAPPLGPPPPRPGPDRPAPDSLWPPR